MLTHNLHLAIFTGLQISQDSCFFFFMQSAEFFQGDNPEGIEARNEVNWNP